MHPSDEKHIRGIINNQYELRETCSKGIYDGDTYFSFRNKLSFLHTLMTTHNHLDQ